MSDRPSRLFASTPKVTQRDAGERLKPPTRCQLCDADARHVFLAVREGHRTRVSNASDFMDKGALSPEYVFAGWIARCSDHYLRDLYRTKRGVWSDFAEDRDGIPTLDDYRRLHGDGTSVRRRANREDDGSEARDVGSDQADAAGPSGFPDGMEGAGRDDWRDSVRRAVGGKWDCYGGSVAGGVPA